MGLDITHCKLVKEPSEKSFTYNLEELILPADDSHKQLVLSYQHCSPYENDDKQCIYYMVAGEQRKGVKRSFYNSYLNDHMYWDKGSFNGLLQYIDKESRLYIPGNIEKNFINNFEEGVSFLAISW